MPGLAGHLLPTGKAWIEAPSLTSKRRIPLTLERRSIRPKYR
jgi:hypothetical protein